MEENQTNQNQITRKKKKHLMDRPILAAIFVPLIVIVAMMILSIPLQPLSKLITPGLEGEALDRMTNVLVQLVTVAFLVLYYKLRYRDGFIFGFTKRGARASILLSLFVTISYVYGVYQGFTLYGGPYTDWENILCAILTGVGAGCFEEILFRGILLNDIMDKWRTKKHRILLAALVSSLSFGLTHLLSLSLHSFEWVCWQILNAVAIGFFFGAVYLRTRNLIGPVLIHALVDISCFIFRFPEEMGRSDKIQILVYAILLGALGLYLLRPAKRQEIEALWERGYITR